MALEGRATLEWVDGDGVVQASTVLGSTPSTAYERVVGSVAVPDAATDDWRPRLVVEKVGADNGFACAKQAQLNPGEFPCNFTPPGAPGCTNILHTDAGPEHASPEGSTQSEYYAFDTADLNRHGISPGDFVAFRWQAKTSNSLVAATLSVNWLDDAGNEVDPGGFLFPEDDTQYREHTGFLKVPAGATQMGVHALRQENGGTGIAYIRKVQVNKGKEPCEFSEPSPENPIEWATIAKIETEPCGTPWDISTAAYPPDNRYPWDNFDANPVWSHDWDPDGSQFLAVGGTGSDPVMKLVSCPEAWDPNNHIGFVEQQSIPNTADDWPKGVFARADGAKVYITYTDQSNQDTTGDPVGGQEIREYDLSTAWEPTTMTEVSSLSLTYGPAELFLKDDGTKMYVVDRDNARVVEYSLSTAWDLTTATETGAVLDVSGEVTGTGGPYGLDFKPDGTALVVGDTHGQAIYKYTLSAAWDLSTASYANDKLDGNENIWSVEVKPEGDIILMLTNAQLNGNSTSPEGQQWEIDTAGQVFIKVAWDASASVSDSIYDARVTYFVDGQRVGQNQVNLSDEQDSLTIEGGSDGANASTHNVYAVVGFGREKTFTVFGEEVTKFAFEVSVQTDVEQATWGTC